MKKIFKKIVCGAVAAVMSAMLCINAFAAGQTTPEQLEKAWMETYCGFDVEGNSPFMDSETLEYGVESSWSLAYSYFLVDSYLHSDEGKEALMDITVEDMQSYKKLYKFCASVGEWKSKYKNKFPTVTSENNDTITQINGEDVEITNDGKNWFIKNKKSGKVIIKFPVLNEYKYINKSFPDYKGENRNEVTSIPNTDTEESKTQTETSTETASETDSSSAESSENYIPINPEIASKAEESKKQISSSKSEKDAEDKENEDDEEEEEEDSSSAALFVIVVFAAITITAIIVVIFYLKKGKR